MTCSVCPYVNKDDIKTFTIQGPKSNIKSMCILFLPFDRCYMILPCYLHSIYIVFTYFASFTGYEDDMFEVISNLHILESKFGKNLDKFDFFLNCTPRVHGVFFL